MKATLFVADLHLDAAARPQTLALFEDFIAVRARRAQALYILGDLFEAWVGDDDPSAAGTLVADKLRALTEADVPAYFIRGNRDFLLGADYAARCGMTLLDDPTVINLYGTPTLLLHGDLLCSDDTAYQQFRSQTRDPQWQAQFLAQPLAARLAFAEQARAASQARYGELLASGQSETITDVTPATVRDWFQRYGVIRMIHGHTHRPAIHEWMLDGQPARRAVLGDWYDRGSVLRCDVTGWRLEPLPLPGI